MSDRLIVDTAALAALLDAAAARPDPAVREALVALVNAGTAPAPRQWLTPAEAADVLGLSVTTVYRRLADGSLPAVKLGQLWRIPPPNVRQRSPTVANPVAGGSTDPDSGANDTEHRA